MKVAFSYSGALSREVAEILSGWLKEYMPLVQPFMAPKNIEPGAIWLGSLSNALQDSVAGLILLTRENMSAPWLHYEAGASAREVADNARVFPG